MACILENAGATLNGMAKIAGILRMQKLLSRYRWIAARPWKNEALIQGKWLTVILFAFQHLKA